MAGDPNQTTIIPAAAGQVAFVIMADDEGVVAECKHIIAWQWSIDGGAWPILAGDDGSPPHWIWIEQPDRSLQNAETGIVCETLTEAKQAASRYYVARQAQKA